MVARPKVTVIVFPYIGSQDDGYGGVRDEWGTGREEKAYGVNLPSSDEPLEAGHNRLVVDYKLLVPPSFRCNEKDHVQIVGYEGTFQVEGVVAMADRNPFGWNPGGHVKLRRIDG